MQKEVENMNWYVLRVMGGKERKTVEFLEKEIDEKSLLKELFSEENSDTISIDLKEKSTKELEDLLKIAVQNENYESAAKIRDEISNR